MNLRNEKQRKKKVELQTASKLSAYQALIDEFVRLTRERRSLEARVEDIKVRLAQIGGSDEAPGELYAIMQEVGVNKFESDGFSIYVHSAGGLSIAKTQDPETGEWVPGDVAVACQALRAAGLAEYIEIKPNLTKLAAVYREDLENRTAEGEIITLADVIPPELATVLTAWEQFTLRALAKAGARKNQTPNDSEE